MGRAEVTGGVGRRVQESKRNEIGRKDEESKFIDMNLYMETAMMCNLKMHGHHSWDQISLLKPS